MIMSPIQKVILLVDVKNLGGRGQVVEVSSGYARNFLLPKNLAKFVSEKELEIIGKQQVEQEKRRARQIEHAKKLAKTLSTASLDLSAAASPEGKLYAGLKAEDILDKLKQGIPGLPGNIKLLDYIPFKEIGEHKVKIKLADEIEAEVKIVIHKQSGYQEKTA